jgi:hypothetical protein
MGTVFQTGSRSLRSETPLWSWLVSHSRRSQCPANSNQLWMSSNQQLWRKFLESLDLGKFDANLLKFAAFSGNFGTPFVR